MKGKTVNNLEKFKGLKSWFCRNFYDKWHPWQEYCWRKISRFKAICDICNKPVGWRDYGYMCRECGDVRYKSKWQYLPKFIFRVFHKKR